MPPEFLVVGHIVKDITPGGWRFGGAVAYAAMQASRLGLRVAAVTACAPDVSPAEALPQVQWHTVGSTTTTTFENRYRDGSREQRVLELATPLGTAHLPPAWQHTPVVLLGPVIGDVDPDMGLLFPKTSLVGLGAQGWLRRLEGDRVRPGDVHPDDVWLNGDVVFVSTEDVEDPEAVSLWRRHVPVVVLTRGRHGCTVWDDRGRSDIAGFPVREVDPTGAGDVFAAAFLVRYHETADTRAAAHFGAAAAALLVSGGGFHAVATRDEIEALVRSREVHA